MAYSNPFSAHCRFGLTNDLNAGTNSSENGDLREVYAIDAGKGNMTRLADLLYARFSFQLVSLPGGDVLAVSGGQHINNTEVRTGFAISRFCTRAKHWYHSGVVACVSDICHQFLMILIRHHSTRADKSID